MVNKDFFISSNISHMVLPYTKSLLQLSHFMHELQFYHNSVLNQLYLMFSYTQNHTERSLYETQEYDTSTHKNRKRIYKIYSCSIDIDRKYKANSAFHPHGVD